jgi:hypothetical protein
MSAYPSVSVIQTNEKLKKESKLSQKKKKKPTDEYEVEEICAVRYDSKTKETHCLIKWVGFDAVDMSWEPLQHVHADELLQAARDHLAKGEQATWEFKYFMDVPMNGRTAGWHLYDQSAQERMNTHFRMYCNDRSQIAQKQESVLSGKSQYDVDFDLLMQKNIRMPPFTERLICCKPL